jgi:hypothetical protein
MIVEPNDRCWLKIGVWGERGFFEFCGLGRIRGAGGGRNVAALGAS